MYYSNLFLLLEREMATHPSILSWRIPWTEEPGRLQSMGLQESDTTECTAQHIFVVVQSLSYVRLFATLWTVARQVPLSFTISRILLKLMSIESVRPSNHLILCHPLCLLPSVFPSIRVFSSESALHIWGQILVI